MSDILSRLDELERIARAATPGPWKVTSCLDYWVEPAGTLLPDDQTGIALCGDIHWPNSDSMQDQWRANAAHIATFDPPTVLALIAAIRALAPEPAPEPACPECLGLKPFGGSCSTCGTGKAPEPVCHICDDGGVVSTTDKDHNGDNIEMPCPECGGDQRLPQPHPQAGRPQPVRSICPPARAQVAGRRASAAEVDRCRRQHRLPLL